MSTDQIDLRARAGVEVPFDQAEYDRRLGNVRTAMRERGVDALLTVDPRNIFYLTGVASHGYTHFQCLVTPASGEQRYLTWDFEAGIAAVTSWLSGGRQVQWDAQSARLADSSWSIPVATYGWLEDSTKLLAEILGEMRLLDSTLAIDLRSFTLSAATFARVRDALPQANFVDSFGLVEKSRLTKSAAELEYMRLAARITDRAVDDGFAAAKPGVPDTEVAAAISSSMYMAGSRTLCWGPIVATGPNAGIGHASFTGRRLERGDTVFFEISASVEHYVTPVMRTGVLGAPTPEMARIRDAGLAALDEVMRLAKPGVPASSVAKAGMAQLAPVIDLVHFHNLFGYSVGIGFPPGWFETLGYELSLQNDAPLEEGMTFHVPISLRKFGEYGVSQSQTIVITKSGCEPLSSASPALRELD